MGRGRAKAKQTKVARALKYYSPTTDLSALEQELHGSIDHYERRGGSREPADVDPFEPAPEGADEDDDYDKWAAGGR